MELERRIRRTIWADPEYAVYLASVEDNLLAKLEWYRLGNEVSDRQWRDILGVIKTQGERLDFAYLRQWAAVLNVIDLLEKALLEAE